MKLNQDNYYSVEANQQFFSVSQYKDFMKCEAMALAKIRGEYRPAMTKAMLTGSFVDTYFEGTLDSFMKEHPEVFTRKKELRSEYRKANEIIQRVTEDKLFAQFMSGEKQRIMTFEMFGVPWKMKMDSYLPGICITDLKVVANFRSLPLWRYTLYEAKQRQRQMETAMRAQREKVKLLQAGGADQDEVILHKAKYQGQLNEYSRFCRKMSLTEERERIYLDIMGKIATNNKSQNSIFHPEMVKNASKDVAQYKRYKEVLGDSVGSLAKFGQVKYNDSEQWEKLQSKFFAYLEINKKDWSEEFKSKSKQAYDRFREQGEELSVHALSRLPRLNKPGYEVIHEEDVLDLIKTMPNYSEGEEKMIWFSPSKQLVVIKNKNSGDIVSIVRRKNKKEEWTDAGL